MFLTHINFQTYRSLLLPVLCDDQQFKVSVGRTKTNYTGVRCVTMDDYARKLSERDQLSSCHVELSVKYFFVQFNKTPSVSKMN